eukprot:CAMPEP_0171271228 /NCGR_PEP_ID=MMETSP0790-20130122/61122_1 /TAXON_ID=2925 /ORGANISM="Alexandrium catenella, Strain OF101" /LENGTH=32 /DNA_ID= /DNA_START= /DNA_END= /DNA_ORIENTATION=
MAWSSPRRQAPGRSCSAPPVARRAAFLQEPGP